MSAQERDVEQPLAGSKRKFDGVDEEKENDDAEYCSPCTDKESTTKASSRRHNAISWDDYFMSVAFLSSMRSKDPSTQVGACIVNPNKRIVGIGYNGFPRGCSDDELPWAREGESELDTKYPYVCHAEVNAILNKNSAEVAGCSIYVGLFPCNECAKVIIQSGIQEVVYMSDKYADTSSMRASRRMFTLAKVSLRQYTPSEPTFTIDFSSIHGTKQEDVTRK
eukprot:gene13355-9562_t